MRSANNIMTVRKIKNSWWVDFRADYIRYRKRSPDNTKAGAEAYEATLRQKLARGEPVNNAAPLPEQELLFKNFAWKWFEEYSIPNNKPSEQRNKRNVLRGSLIPFFGNIRVDRVTTRDIAQFKAKELAKGLKSKSVNNKLATLGKLLRTAYEWHNFKQAPPTVELLKCPPPKTEYLSREECVLLLSNSDGLTHDMILLALRTGMRLGEIMGLQWTDVDWQSQTIHVCHSWDDRAKKLGSPKSNRSRLVPMDADVYALLYRRKKDTGFVFLNEEVTNEVFHSRYLSRRLEEACKRAGLRHIGWHALRHTFASHLTNGRVPLNVVKALLGHSNVSTTMRYVHHSTDDLRQAITILSPKTAFSADFGQPAGNTQTEVERQETKNPLPTRE